MRFLDNVCHLGGFHPASDGADSELCYLNEGELIMINNIEPQGCQDQGLLREDRETNQVKLYFS